MPITATPIDRHRPAERQFSSQQLAFWGSLMRRFAVLIASAAVNVATIPAVAAECTSIKGTDASCARWATVPANATDKEKSCRAYAASFYESVMLRQAAAHRLDGARVLAAIDSVINAFNDLLATKCGVERHCCPAMAMHEVRR
jgi:hypothetical protein